jgi:alkanesulfonate monooxygenase SsuD/methylene tetrahydromethanopterin reductase-like flavin-dependent oxidoreductase (luciferase family)
VFKHKSQVLEQHRLDLGRDFGEMTRSGNYNVVIGATEADVQDRLSWIQAHYEPLVPADRLADTMKNFSGRPLVGTPEQIVERLQEAAGLGLGYAITYFVDAAYDTSGLELFEREVIPALA